MTERYYNHSFDRNKSNFIWSKDDKYLYFTAQMNGGNVLHRLNTLTQKRLFQALILEYPVSILQIIQLFIQNSSIKSI
jgi:hypothetical protein